jgi:hypothetical protein
MDTRAHEKHRDDAERLRDVGELPAAVTARLNRDAMVPSALTVACPEHDAVPGVH